MIWELHTHNFFTEKLIVNFKLNIRTQIPKNGFEPMTYLTNPVETDTQRNVADYGINPFLRVDLHPD